jgi:hypothetical protein
LAELIEKKVLFGGDGKERVDILQLDVIWEITGSPTDENWPGAKLLSNFKEVKNPVKGCLRERFLPYV